MLHTEHHRSERIGWLRAAVLGANDGTLSTSSLILGIAAAGGLKSAINIAALAALVAGAMSMAAGEYVPVSSQADPEMADLEREHGALTAAPEAESAELPGIYVSCDWNLSWLIRLPFNLQLMMPWVHTPGMNWA